MKIILLCILLAFANSAQAGEFDYSSYKPAELAPIVAEMEIDPRANYWFDASHAKYKTEVEFTGAFRPIDANVKQLIIFWAKALQHPESVPAVFNYEVQVTQAGQTYWMPIQDVLFAPWQEEILKGMKAEVYLLFMGAYNRTPVFTIASFSAKV